MTLGYKDIIFSSDVAQTAKFIREDHQYIQDTYAVSKEMIAQSRLILDRLNDRLLIRLVDITELRLDNYFHRDLKME